MVTDNLKFSKYNFSRNEKIFTDKELEVQLPEYENRVQYIVVADMVSTETAMNQIQELSSLLKEIGKNPNHKHYSEHEIVYVTNEEESFVNPTIILSKENWDWLHGVLVGYWYSDIFNDNSNVVDNPE